MTQSAIWAGEPRIKGATEFTRMALLSFSLVGLQFTWGMEMTYCTPYLLDLGLTKSKTSMVWVAGPLSGFIMAPMVGAIADRSKSRFGRRRPFMISCAILVSCCLYTLGWARDIVIFFRGEYSQSATIALAVFSIYALDFAINAVQWSSRGLIVDSLPATKQQEGFAWASRMVAIGHIAGCTAGSLNLGSIFGTMLGDNQFKRMTAIAAFALLFTVGVSSYAVTEKVLVSEGDREKSEDGVFAIVSRILRTLLNMPPRIRAICWCQFWAWIAWFPFLFYSATWIGEIYMRYEAPSLHSSDTLGEMGRVGSSTLILFGVVTLASTIILPLVVLTPNDEEVKFTPRPPANLAPLVEEMQRNKPTLLTMWFVSQFMFAFLMSITPLVKSLRVGTLIVAASGIPWALMSWCPFTFIGVEISRLESGQTDSRYNKRSSKSHDTEGLRNSNDGNGAPKGLAGIYLGLLNLFTTSAQLVSTLISTIVFSIVEPGKSPEFGGEAEPAKEGRNAISVTLLLGACSSLGAAYAISRFKKMG